MLLSFVLSTLLAVSVALPGGPPVGMDYLAFDRATGRLWVPAGNTGNVDVVEIATGKVTTVGGFPTAPARRPGRPRMGPSSAAVGDGVVWIGNRANNEHLRRRRTHPGPRPLPSPAVDARRPGLRRRHARGLGHDAARSDDHRRRRLGQRSRRAGRHQDRRRSRGVRGRRRARHLLHERRGQGSDAGDRRADAGRSWPAGRPAAAPPGHAGWRSTTSGACCSSPAPTARSRATSAQWRGKEVGRLKTAGGVDNIDYAPKRGLLFVASGLSGTLTVARVGGTGALSAVTSVPTAQGARCVVVAGEGTAYVADSAGGRLIIVPPPP